ncbi:putative disease resistance protein RGA3 [Salvia hispanica]|uniref:putative disease resistance protein RGA3 n=1 Tax=Salvia hispanica TaxID=49212 RepID=UPI0020090B3E|nr:putative disease resistance protein RGA3 [Salvia hispanica]
MIVNAPVVTPVSFETDPVSVDPIFIGRDDDVPKLVHMLTQTHQEEEKRMFSIVALVGMGGGDECQSKEAILRKLKDALKEKTYFLVLDDVWNEDIKEWEGFMNSMSGVTSTMGNGIIITTRSQNVASIVTPLEYTLSGLSDDECWSIIKEKAFDANGEVPPEFEMIGKEIAKRCQGLPLAANVVGGVLRHKSEEEWRLINEKGLSNGEGAENIKEILKLSFDYLSPPPLKRCFAYCSVFPKGKEIVKQDLIELWMGEEFLQLNKEDDMESLGNMFFNVLIQNSLLQVAKGDYLGDVVSYVMHDLVHDLASSVLSNRTPIRYMYLKKGSSPIPKEVAKHLRTLIFEGDPSHTKFSNFKSLRNLTLTSYDCKELPNSIRELIHLRKLDILCTSIENLPGWIGELHHLQTLSVGNGGKKLPNTLTYLINLRRLYVDSDKLPVKIGRLTSLQTLPEFSVGNEKGYWIEELRSLKNLKKSLKIQHLERVCDEKEVMKANMLEKPNLHELVLQWDEVDFSERNDESVLEGLRPHANLKKLTIDGYRGKRFPTWLQGEGSILPLHNLIKLNLTGCSECEEITLYHLPNLRSFFIRELKSLKCLPKRFFYNHCNLSYLDIYDCDMLEALPDGLDTLNSLEVLSIERCKNLKSIGNPSCGGEGENQGNLRELSIRDCGELMELPRQMLELWAPTIEVLELEGLRSLTNLPMLIDCLAKSSHLRTLEIRGIPKLMSAGSVESWDLGSLKWLEIDVHEEWPKETSVAINETVNGILEGCCNSLERLTLRRVDIWEWLPQSINRLTSLWDLKLENIGIEELRVENWEWLPQSIQRLTSLSWLKLENIGIEELPQWLGNLSALETLRLDGCTKLRCLPSMDALKHLTKFGWLYINNCPKLSIDSEWRNHHPKLIIR